jgi:NADH:ubiquinone oxidoreductase subunit
MGLFGKFFSPTWWNGATFGTALWTKRNGSEVGADEAGNTYFESKGAPKRRWVIYAGSNDGSRVPPGWQAWLRGTIDELPEQGLPPRRRWEKEPVPNLTGSDEAWVPSGSLRAEGVRAATTGDYSAWTPDQG